MLLAQLSDGAIVELIFGCLTVMGAAGGSYLATRITLAQLVAEVSSLKAWIKTIADGERNIDGKIETRLNTHDETIEEHHRRISYLELEHARFKPFCEERHREQGS